MQLNDVQQKTFNFIIKVYGNRTKGHEDDIQEIITTTSNLISEMQSNGDLGNFITKEYSDSCLKNGDLLYDILERIKPKEKILEDENTVYLILIMYYHQCEALSFLFRDFVSKYAKAIAVKPKDIEKWQKRKKRKMIRLDEIKKLLNNINKNKESITLQDFISVFNQKYPEYSKKLFEGRIIPPLRNAISHNRLTIDSKEKIVSFYYNSKEIKITFVKIFDLYDTLMMIYLAIIIELTQPRA